MVNFRNLKRFAGRWVGQVGCPQTLETIISSVVFWLFTKPSLDI